VTGKNGGSERLAINHLGVKTVQNELEDVILQQAIG
jgi:hypothetical protein